MNPTLRTCCLIDCPCRERPKYRSHKSRQGNNHRYHKRHDNIVFVRADNSLPPRHAWGGRKQTSWWVVIQSTFKHRQQTSLCSSGKVILRYQFTFHVNQRRFGFSDYNANVGFFFFRLRLCILRLDKTDSIISLPHVSKHISGYLMLQ